LYLFFLVLWYVDVSNTLNSYPTNNYEDKYVDTFCPTKPTIISTPCKDKEEDQYLSIGTVRPIILTLEEELDVIIPIFFRVVNRKSNELRIDLKVLWQQTNRTDKSKA